MFRLAVIGSSFLICGIAAAGELAIGAKAPAWKDLPGTDGKKHSLAELAGHKAVLVIFFENTCPDCELYTDRVRAIIDEFKPKGVATVLVSVSSDPENDLAPMAKLAREKKLNCQYLSDKSQKLGKAFGATVTPEAYLFAADRTLVYHGAVDDHANDKRVKRQHLRLAIEQTLTGKMVETAVTKAKGCHIEYEK